jgi:uncharacterized protein (TIGR03435 family)
MGRLIDMKGDPVVRAIMAACAIALVCSPAWSQGTADGKAATDAKLEFEVASIKASAPLGNGPIRIGRGGGPGSNDPGRVNYYNSALRDLLMNAYGVKRNQVSGPDWLDSERFDIVAKVPEAATKEQVSIMLQNLLADRFKAVVHRETKELPIYALVVGSKGPKLKDAAPPAAQPAEGGRGDAMPPPLPGPPKMDAEGCPQPPPAFAGRGMNLVMMTLNGACMVSTGQTISNFADMLSNQFDRPVVDQTGLKGKYDFKLRYDPSSMPGRRGMGMFMMAGPPPGGMPGGGGDGGRRGPDAQEREPAPNIFAAVQEQLGLKLEAKKAPVELLVIDHIEKTPTEN